MKAKLACLAALAVAPFAASSASAQMMMPAPQGQMMAPQAPMMGYPQGQMVMTPQGPMMMPAQMPVAPVAFFRHCCPVPNCPPITPTPPRVPVMPNGWNGGGPNLQPPFPPFQGILPTFENNDGAGANAGALIGYVRSPRDYFMYYDR